MADQPGARSAERHADGGFGARRRTARQQQIGDVGAGDQQHKPGDDQNQTKTGSGLVLHAGNALSAGTDDDMLLADQRAIVGCEVRLAAKPSL